jgi:hypothetical protein
MEESGKAMEGKERKGRKESEMRFWKRKRKKERKE